MNERRRQEAQSLLGIAQRAGKVVSGDAALVVSLRRGEGELLILATDCAKNNRERYTHLAQREGIRLCSFSTKTGLGAAIGKAQRAAVLVTDRGLADAIIAKTKE